jgi:hypothetical protein
VHIGRVENLALDLIRARAHWLRAGSVEEQFLVRSRPSPEFFFERGKSMLRDQDQGAREAKRIRPAVKIVDIGYRGSLGFVGQDFTMKLENGNKAALKSLKRALVHSKNPKEHLEGRSLLDSSSQLLKLKT